MALAAARLTLMSTLMLELALESILLYCLLKLPCAVGGAHATGGARAQHVDARIPASVGRYSAWRVAATRIRRVDHRLFLSRSRPH